MHNIRSDFEENGFLVVPNLVDNLECSDIIKNAYEFHKNESCESYSPIMQPHRKSKNNIFFKTMKKKKILDIVKILIGGKVMGLQSQFFFMPSNTPGFQPHQDDYYVRSEDFNGFVSCWIALTNVNKENGCLKIWPSSHNKGIFKVKTIKTKSELNTDKNGSKISSVIPKELSITNDIEIKKGAGIFLHSRILHSSYRNSTDDFRYAILYTYIREKLKFTPGFNAKRVAIDL